MDIFTSDLPDAGTDAAVLIEMHGSEGTVGPLEFDNAERYFERASQNTFNCEGSSIGEIDELRVWLDPRVKSLLRSCFSM